MMDNAEDQHFPLAHAIEDAVPLVDQMTDTPSQLGPLGTCKRVSAQQGERFPKAARIIIRCIVTELRRTIGVDGDQVGARSLCQPKPDCAVPAARR